MKFRVTICVCKKKKKFDLATKRFNRGGKKYQKPKEKK
jgi:hypothetical protein